MGNEGKKSGEMREHKEKWQLCLSVSIHAHLWQPPPSADLRNPWTLTGAFFYYQWCWRILTWVLLLWPQMSFFCEVMNKLGEKKCSSEFIQGLSALSPHIFSALCYDFRLCCRWCMSHRNVLYQFSKSILQDVLHESVLVFTLFLGDPVKLSSDSTGQTSCVFSSSGDACAVVLSYGSMIFIVLFQINYK